MGGRGARGATAPAHVPPDDVRVAVRGHACARRRTGAAEPAPAAWARECVVAALFVFAAVLLTASAVARVGRARRNAGGDGPATVLALAVGGLPESHRDWGRAMCAELETVCGGGPRWRFSLGCARAAALIRARVTLTSRECGGAGLRAVVGAGVCAALALAGYGLVRYPGLRSGGDAGIAAVAFVGLLVAYGAVTMSLSRGAGLREVTARRHGMVGAVVIGAAWLVVLSPIGVLKEWVLVPLIVALLGPGCVAALAARAGADVTAGSRAALWSGIVAGLLVFTVWMTATYARDGRPYDAQLLRDFRIGGAPDLATLAIGDALGSALTMLILIPLTALAFGSLGARVPRTTDPTATALAASAPSGSRTR